MTPVLPPDVVLINLDMSHFYFARGSLKAVLRTSKASLDIMTDLVDDPRANTLPVELNATEAEEAQSAEIFNLLIQYGQYRHTSEQYEGDPLTSLSYPVFDKFGDNQRVAGAIYTTMYWRFFFTDILPENIYGVECVIENSFGQQATYRIDGRKAIFLGMGDLHASKYDSLERELDVESSIEDFFGPATRSFSSVDLQSDFINYQLRIYPTEDFRSIYVTDSARDEALAIGSVFCLAAVIFLLYDYCVRRRQRIVLDRAVKSTSVVSSLFPENVRDRILNEDENEKKDIAKRMAFRQSAHNTAAQSVSGPPIADKFPDATVFFGDLAGFTKWSSTREPEQVFQLLEALFKQFDALALRRGVFKVEVG
jgi:hypothetical protein